MLQSSQFEKAQSRFLDYFNSTILVYVVPLEELVKQGDLKGLLLRSEARYGDYLNILEKFSQHPKVNSNEDELGFLGIVMQDYQKNYYALRGMVAEVKDGKQVNLKLLQSTLAALYTIGQCFSIVVPEVFGHYFEILKENEGK